MKDKKVFITGGAGFIGTNLVKYLLENGNFNITVYDDLSNCGRGDLDKAVAELEPGRRFKFVEGDISRPKKLEHSMKRHEMVVHLAARTSVPGSVKKPREDFITNAAGTFNVLEAARKNRVKKFIFASSNAAVGEHAPPINERSFPAPVSPYGSGKLCGEALCSSFFRSYGLKTAVLRFANAYGPYSGHKTSVVARFIKRAKQNKPLEIYGNGEQTRDFIYVSDICRVIHYILEAPLSKQEIWGGIFQIATGKETRIIDLAGMVRDMAVSEKRKAISIIHQGERDGDIKMNYADIAKARKVLGFNPVIALKTGIAETFSNSGGH